MQKKSDNKPKAKDTGAPTGQATTATANNETPVRPTSGFPLVGEPTYRTIFFASILFMLLLTWVAGMNVGFNSDEIEMNGYGKANYAFYMSGGKDTSVMGEQYKMLKYYGNAFEAIAIGVNKMTGLEKGPNEFNTRHFINQIFGILGLLFAGFTAQKVTKKWLAAILTAWLLYLTPSFMGHIFFNTRDIPFCTGYIACIYFMICFFEELPLPTWKTTIGVMVSFAFTTNVRIGGLLLVIYLFLFFAVYVLSRKELIQPTLKNVVPIFLKLAAIAVGGYVLIYLTWPLIIIKPMALFDALTVASKFPMKVNINFEGTPIDSLNVPVHYIPKYMAVTIPIVVMVAILGGIGFYFARFRNYDWRLGALILFSSIFPIAYAIVTHAAIYSGWRHFLFAFPGLCIFGSVFIVELLHYFEKPAGKMVVAGLLVAGMVRPVMFCINNNPYEYCYFNELAGDFKKAFMEYDNDYWEISVKNAVKWLVENEHLDKTKDTVTLSCNAAMFTRYYIDRHYPGSKIKVVPTGVTGRNGVYWQYAVYNSLFLKPDYLDNYFPPPQTYHAETIDGVTVTAIVKDTARLDYKALEALKAAKHHLADSLYETYMRTTNDRNAALFAYLSIVKGSLGRNDEAIQLANNCLQYHFSTVLDYNAYCGLGIAYCNKREYQLSVANLQNAMRILPNETYAKDIMRQVEQVIQANGGMPAK